jgi:riboflavin synthase
METELNLIKTMIDVLIYEKNVAENPNIEVINIAQNTMRETVLNIKKVLSNPSKYDNRLTPEDDLLS